MVLAAWPRARSLPCVCLLLPPLTHTCVPARPDPDMVHTLR